MSHQKTKAFFRIRPILCYWSPGLLKGQIPMTYMQDMVEMVKISPLNCGQLALKGLQYVLFVVC